MYNGGPIESRIYGLSNGAIFIDLEQPQPTPGFKVTPSLTLNISETVRDT